MLFGNVDGFMFSAANTSSHKMNHSHHKLYVFSSEVCSVMFTFIINFFFHVFAAVLISIRRDLRASDLLNGQNVSPTVT